jgi:hypothetical protein
MGILTAGLIPWARLRMIRARTDQTRFREGLAVDSDEPERGGARRRHPPIRF